MKFVRNHGKFKYLIDKWTWAFVVLASCERVFLLPNFFTIVHTIETFKWSTAAYAFMGNLTLELSHQSNWLVLQFYFKIFISCYIFFPQWCNDFHNNNQRINTMNFILFFIQTVIQTENNFVSSQNDWYLSKCKRVLQSIYRTPINQFPRFVQLATRS